MAKNTSWLRLLMTALLLVAFVAAALPQPTQAQSATSCRTYYWPKEGDSTSFIAKTFGLKWRTIANANSLKVGELPEVGERLCIPFKEAEESQTAIKVPANDPKATIQVSINNGRITLTLNKFSEEHEYRVKARNVDVGVGGWENLGRISLDDDDRIVFTYTVPSRLRSALYLNVCLKDQKTDELLCRVALNR